MSKTFSTERICAFTDGVYAIVITLLVLELKAPEVPGLTNEQVFADILKQSRVFLAYFISFFCRRMVVVSPPWNFQSLGEK